MDSRKSVNDIWKELQSATAPKGRLGGLGAISYGVQRSHYPKRQPKPPSFIDSLRPAPQPSSSTDVLATLQRDVNCLGDTDRRLRTKALESISAKLLGGGASPLADQQLQEAVCGGLRVPLIRLLADPSEKCRELAIGLLEAALQRIPDASGLLPTLVPALAERVGSVPVEETSEEIRLLLAQLVGVVVRRHAGALADEARDAGGALLGPVVQVLCRGLEDSYPDVKKVACGTVACMASSSACSSAALEPHLDALLASLLPLLQHQHSRVRLAALEALHALVLRGLRHADIEGSVAPAVRLLAHDHAPGVRVALFLSATQWMGGAPGGGMSGALQEHSDGRLVNQCRFSTPLFLPTLMLGLTDELPEIRSNAMKQLEWVADAYQALQDSRPSPASRALVQSQLPRIMPLVASGAGEWTAGLRAGAARLLHAALVYSGAAVVPHLPAVMQALRAGVGDGDADVAAHALAAARALGASVPARHWAPFAAEGLADEQLGTAQRATGLQLLGALLTAAGSAGQPAGQETVQLLAAALGSEAVLGAAAHEGQLREQLQGTISSLVRWGSSQCCEAAPRLLRLLLRLEAAERRAAGGSRETASGAVAALRPAVAAGAEADPAVTAEAVVNELAALGCGLAAAQQLCDHLAPTLLPVVCQGHEAWDSSSPDWHTFSSLLRYCGPATLASQSARILAVLRPLGPASHDRDPELRLAALVLLEELLRDASKREAWQGGLGAALAEQVLLPALVWRAGKAPADARYAAMRAVATLLSSGLLPEHDLLGLCLDEDYIAETRHVACHALEHLLKSVGRRLPPEQLAEARRELLRRLDDSTDAARVAACAALHAYLALPLPPGQLLPPPCGPGAAIEEAGAECPAGELAATLLVHMDDREPAVQEAACSVLEDLARLAPAALRPHVAAACGVHRGRVYLERVLAACDDARPPMPR